MPTTRVSAIGAWTRWRSPWAREAPARAGWSSPRSRCSIRPPSCWSCMELGLHETIAVVPGLLNLTHVRNSGVAFGFLNAAELRVQAGVDGAAGVRRADRRGACMRRSSRRIRSGRAPALALILGGAAGNLVDRARQGYVVDFVDAYWGALAFLGVQRGRRGHQRRREPADHSTCAAGAAGERRLIAEAFACFRNCSSSARSRSTRTACCWRRPICWA